MKLVWKAADATIFKKIRARMGGELWLAISGAAPLGKDLANFFAAIGMPIHEGYGLTEGGIVALNPIGKAKSGSIGKPFPGVEFKIAEDGELLIRSGTLFLEYFGDPTATAAVLRDGWLHTGDLGKIDDDGYYYITGRKKEVIVSSNGKKIYPAMVEALLKMEALINQVLLVGDKLPYVAALFTLNPAVAEALPGMEEYKGKPMEELVKAPPLVAEIKKLIGRVNKQLAPFEQIRRHVIIPRDFTIEAGELTPTMKVRRGKVLENHKAAIQELYQNREDSI
jgi:long-chain acyl-CoA synthetase